MDPFDLRRILVARVWLDTLLPKLSYNLSILNSLRLNFHMLPITLLNAAQGLEVNVECKSGRKYAGKVQACDLFMNVTLENVTLESAHQDEPKTYPELYLKGYSIKYVKIPDKLLEDIVEERLVRRQELYASQSPSQISRRDGRRRF